MKTRISNNSLEAYQKYAQKLGKVQREILECISKNPNITSAGICNSLGLKINVVTGRLNELMHKQMIKVTGTAQPRNVNRYAIRLPGDPLNEFEPSLKEKYTKALDERNVFLGLLKQYKIDPYQRTMFN